MKKLFYAGTELTTGDDIAIAVLRYCAALAEAQMAELIEIPVVTGGSRGKATFILGPSSQMIALDVEGYGEEIIDLDLIARLQERTRAQRPTAHSDQHGEPADSSPPDHWQDHL